MDSPPSTSPTVHDDTSGVSAPLLDWLGRIAWVTLLVLAAMYLATILVGASVSITLTGMLGITDGTTIFWFKLVYMALLFASVLSHLRGNRLPAFMASIVVVVMTLSAVVYSLVVDYRPSFYDWYFGEMVTVVAAALLAMVSIWSRSRGVDA